jgi:hypothetical protein
MNAHTPSQYELYRVILDYEALQDGFLDRIDDLDTTMEQIEMAADMARGQLQKCLTKNPGKAIARKRDHRSASNRRLFEWKSLGKALKGTGLALLLVVDDERFAPIKEQLILRRRRPSQANASAKRPTWLFTKKKAREMGKKRWSLLTPEQRKKLARKMQRASAKSRRRKARLSRTLVEQPAPQFDVALPPGAIDAHPARTTPSAYQMPRNPC